MKKVFLILIPILFIGCCSNTTKFVISIPDKLSGVFITTDSDDCTAIEDFILLADSLDYNYAALMECKRYSCIGYAFNSDEEVRELHKNYDIIDVREYAYEIRAAIKERISESLDKMAESAAIISAILNGTYIYLDY